jgi:hypothetical protein
MGRPIDARQFQGGCGLFGFSLDISGIPAGMLVACGVGAGGIREPTRAAASQQQPAFRHWMRGAAVLPFASMRAVSTGTPGTVARLLRTGFLGAARQSCACTAHASIPARLPDSNTAAIDASRAPSFEGIRRRAAVTNECALLCAPALCVLSSQCIQVTLVVLCSTQMREGPMVQLMSRLQVVPPHCSVMTRAEPDSSSHSAADDDRASYTQQIHAVHHCLAYRSCWHVDCNLPGAN